MAKLKQAGIIEQFVTWLSPKQLTAHVRTEVLSNGQVNVVPVFEIDGQEVSAELVGSGSSQKILGYNVSLDAATQRVQRDTQGKPMRLSKKKAADFLSQFRKSGVAVRNKDGRVEPRIADVKPNVSVILGTNDILTVDSELTTKDGVVVEKPTALHQLKEDEGWYVSGENLVHVAVTGTELDQVLLPDYGPQTFQGDNVPKFIKLLDENRKSLGDVEKNSVLEPLEVFGDKTEHRAKVDGDANSISISPTLVVHGPRGSVYDQTPDALGDFEKKGGGFQRVADGWIEMTPETIRAHRQARQELEESVGPLTEITGTAIPKALSTLLAQGGPGNTAATAWTVYFSKAVKDAHRVVDVHADVKFHLNIVERDGRSLLALDPMYNHERFKLSQADVERLAKTGEEWLRRENTWVKIDAEKFKKINESGSTYPWMERSDSGFLFPASERERAIDLFSILGSIQHSASYADFVAKLADFEKIEDVPLPKCLRPGIDVRPYQRHGYNWLAFLHRFGLNGILADDMGLGKTLQTLAVIQRARELSGSKFPTLIVCPTSVVQNWRAEVEKFFSDTCVIVYTGVPRQRERQLALLHGMLAYAHKGYAGPIVVTSYSIARLDHEKLNRIPWLYVVADEGHNIKNPDAQTTKALKTINGQHKLALTGTPIQNNLEELWSLFDYAMPGYLGNRTNFRATYATNGRVNWDAVKGGKAPLKDRIHPFIMRRLKENVAKDLPQKTIAIRQVELKPIQRALYEEVTQSAECRKLCDDVERNGVARSKVQILAAYTKLRNICNHPVLAGAKPPEKIEDSGKLDCLEELFTEILEGEHRALLFCQSTRMLDIIESFCPKWHVRTMRLDGSTPAGRRQAMVDEFNGDASVNCFLISTRAGGTGLNLCGADTVIFYDHDWNPANDNQAQDRAHRIGQKKPVTVYKLVSFGTIEDKILQRQETKQSMADQIVGADEEGFKDLSKEELLGLFKLDEPLQD